MKVKTKQDYRKRRHVRLRQRIQGTNERPRMAVHVSGKHMTVQLIDDGDSRTLAAASTVKKLAPGKSCTVADARQLGADVARLAAEKGISAVVFDRGGHTYVGKVKALAEAAREGGLKI
jgi:large subunit ribosomal protein L18